jgi:hypothetical protein
MVMETQAEQFVPILDLIRGVSEGNDPAISVGTMTGVRRRRTMTDELKLKPGVEA